MPRTLLVLGLPRCTCCPLPGRQDGCRPGNSDPVERIAGAGAQTRSSLSALA